ncbi:Pyrimidine-nucleoside phosphorylase [compost metagenome]
MVLAQGGEVAQIDDPSLLPEAELKIEVKSDRAGYVESIQAEEIGIAAMLLGAGRETKDSVIDLAAGVDLHKKIGDPVQVGEVLAVLHLNTPYEKGLAEAKSKVLNAYGISDDKVPNRPLVFALVTPEGIKRF